METTMKKSIKLFLILLFITSLESCVEEMLSPERFQKKLTEEKGVLIDVRTSEEYAEEHIDGAINGNVQDVNFKKWIDSLDKSKAYFLYCKSGKRSAQAMDMMKENGFKKLYMLKGGMIEWRLKEMPVVKKEIIKNSY